MGQEEVDLENRINGISWQLQQLSLSPLLIRSLTGDCQGLDCGGQLKLLLQARALLTKNLLYQKLDASLHRLSGCTATVHAFLTELTESTCQDGSPDTVTAAQRDTAVANLRFLNIFCNFRHDTFAHAVQLLDLVLGRVKVHPNFLSSVSTCCLYIAAKSSEPPALAAGFHELLVLGHCGGSLADLFYTERLIFDLLGAEVVEAAASCNPLSFLRSFYEILMVDLVEVLDGRAPDLSLLVSKLEVIVCQFEFTRCRADLLSLALLSLSLQSLVNDSADLVPLTELQYYCQMSDGGFGECRDMITRCLLSYQRQPTRTPRLRLSWSVSRRTLHKMRPSTRAVQDLEPIMEDESLLTGCFSNDDGDSSPFDSEVDGSGMNTAGKSSNYGPDTADDDDESSDLATGAFEPEDEA